MSVVTKLVTSYKRLTAKHFVLSGVFMLALAGAIGAGFASRATTLAAFKPECDANAVMYCGAENAKKFCDQLSDDYDGRNHNLKAVYADIGLPFSECDDFADKAVDGLMHDDGSVTVDGKIVATNGQSMGRQNYNNSTKGTFGGQTFYYGPPSKRWADGVKQIPVMVWFDNNGEVRAVIMNPCGNPLPYYNPRTPEVKCQDLIPHPVKKNTYQFSTDAYKNDLVKYVKFNYYYHDGSKYVLFDTKTNPSDKTKEITFDKASKVKVEIEVTLPGNTPKTITSTLCEYEVGVVKEEFLYQCQALIKTVIDNKTFRFNAIAKKSDNVKLVSVDFTLDGTTTVKGVTTDEDNDGNIDRKYTFTDNKSHKVSAVINFLVDGKMVQSKETCEAFTDKTPECKPNIPVGSRECEDLPKTGPAGAAGLFAGVTAAGAVAHRWFMNRRGR